MKHIRNFPGASLVAMLGVWLLCLTTAGRAQQSPDEAPELQRDWTLRLGVYVFQSTAARSAAGDVGLSAIAERTVYYGQGWDLNIGVGYNGINDVYSVPISIMAVAHQHKFRWGVGTGYSYGKRIDGRGLSGTLLTLLLGYELRPGRNPLSADLRYNFVSGANNELDGYSLTFGIRF